MDDDEEQEWTPPVVRMRTHGITHENLSLLRMEPKPSNLKGHLDNLNHYELSLTYSHPFLSLFLNTPTARYSQGWQVQQGG